MDKIKILLPINIDRWRSPIATLLRACAEYNTNFEFYSFSFPETEEDIEKGKYFWSLPNVFRINLSTMIREKYDIIHIASHTSKNIFAGTLCKVRSFFQAKFLYTINLELTERDRKSAIYHWFNAVVDDYVSVSHAASKMVLRDQPGRFHGVIPNGYDADYFCPVNNFLDDIPDQIRSLNGKPYILNVAALEDRKHPEWIIKLAIANPDLQFVMVGWIVPGLGEPYLKLIELSKLPNLIWLGHVNRSVIRALLRYASVFAFPSEREGLPLSVIEAMGMGVPVVAQPKSSLPELIVSEACGRLIDIDRAESIDEWSQSLREFLERSEFDRNQFGNQLVAHTKNLYSWEAIGHAYGRLYQNITQGSSYSIHSRSNS